MAWLTSSVIEPFYRLLYGRLPAAQGEATPARGLVLVADGVGGLDLCGTGLRYMLGMARLPYTVELFPWGHGLGRWFADLTDVANQDRQAKLIAEAVRHFRSEHAEEPVFLVAKSGGTGLVVKALEQLEAESVERVVLLAPAVSPGYDLTRALPQYARKSSSSGRRWTSWSWASGRASSARSIASRRPPRAWWASCCLATTIRTRIESASTPSCARSAGGPGWRRPAIGAVMSGRTIRGSSANTWSRCCADDAATVPG